MFEGLIVDLLNNYLGRYIQNLDPDDLRVGIFSGNVELTNLQLRPEALFELDLPIEVKAGCIGRICLEIPWTSLYSSSVQCSVEDVYILAGPISDRPYDESKESDLENARKMRSLELLEASGATLDGEALSQNQTFTQQLKMTIINNIQITFQKIHIRYEDKSTNAEHPFACGLLLEEASLETTNSAWKPELIDSGATVVHKLLRIHSFSIYWNPYLPEQGLVRNKIHTSAWRNQLKGSIGTHRIGEEDFEFFLRPISTSARLILNKDGQNQIPTVVANIAMEDLEVLLSRQQFLSILCVYESLRVMSVNQRYRKYRPPVEIKGNYKAWWTYAFTAVREEIIRPFSWKYIQRHREKYKEYKNRYKKYLKRNKDEELRDDLFDLEKNLDVANVIMAREHAKIEIATESPNRVTKKKPEKKGWFSWWWPTVYDDDEDDEEEEVIVNSDDRPTLNLPEWLDRLKTEEQQKLFKGIGYDENKTFEHSSDFITHKIVMNLSSCSLSLINYGKEVLKMSSTNLSFNVDNRPQSNGFGTCLKSESFTLEGVSVEHELIPIVTSAIGVYAPSAVNQLFSLEFDMSPLHVDANFSVKLNVKPVEVIYDEHAVTEIAAFFQVPFIIAKEMKTFAQAGLSHFAQFSRASLQYAIEQHKTLHLSVNMRSPYIVIPEYGTLHRGGNVVIIDFGKLKIESELQPKQVNLEGCTMSEIQSRLYDKFIVTVSEVKMLLADSGDDWHTAQTKPDSEFHVLPNFGLQLAFFNTVKAEFKQRPKHKLESKLSTLKVNLSDEKLQMLADFYKHIPVPHSNSMMGLDDSVDGGQFEPVIPVMDEKEVQLVPSFVELVQLRKAVRQNSVVRGKAKSTKKRTTRHSAESDQNFVASDCSDDEADEWTKNLDVRAVDDPNSLSNLVEVDARFVVGEVVLQISKVEDKIETPYLMLRVDRVCADVAVTTYGMVLQMRLGGIQLADKIHRSASGQYLELIGFKTESDLMSLVYRQISVDCPDFESVYDSLKQGIVIKLSSIHVNFNREAVLFLNAFVQGLFQSVQGNLQTTLRKSNSTILSGPTTAEPYQAPMPSFIDRLTLPDDASSSVTKLRLVVKLNDLNIRLCDHENDLIDVTIKDMEGRLIMKTSYTIMEAKLKDFAIDDRTENTLYPRVLFLDDDNAFELKRITYHRTSSKGGGMDEKKYSIDGSLKLRIGRVQGVFIYKLINDIQNFLQPFANPDVIESYTISAQHAVYNTIQDMHDQGTRISVFLDIHAPTILIPQHSESTNVIVVKLGDCRIKNCFEDSDIGHGVLQHWDHIFLSLEAMQIMRGKLNLNENVEHVHTLVEPINLSVDLRRALPPHRMDLHYDIEGRLKNIRVQLTELDLRVVLAVLRDNFLEEFTNRTDSLDATDFGVSLSRSAHERMICSNSVDTMTPVVEIEEPLLMAPEVMELVQATKFNLNMEGVTIVLLTGDDDDLLAPSSPVHGDGVGGPADGLASFTVEGVNLGGMINSDSLMEVRLSLRQLTLNDIRQFSNLAVKKLVRTGLSETRGYAGSPPVLDLVYRRTSEGNRQIDVNLDTVRINICVQYMLMIYNFFLLPLREFEESYVPPLPSSGGSANRCQAPHDMEASQHDTESAGPGLVPTSQALKVLAKFKQLEILLFAEPTDKHSRVLVLKTNAFLDYTCLQERQEMDAKIRQLQIISCVYGKTAQTSSVELYPCDIELTCSRESYDKQLKADIKVTEINLYVSPATVRIFIDVIDILRESGGRRKNVENEFDVTANTGQHFDLWSVNDISAEPWLVTTGVDEAERKDADLTSEGPAMESLHIDVRKVKVVFEIEKSNYYVPRLCLKTGFEADVRDWSKRISAQVDLPVEMLYYNDRMSVWEPLIEPVMIKEDSYRAWEVSFQFVRAESLPLSCRSVDLKLSKEDAVDGQIHEFWAKHQSRSDADSSSESETDSETEMTVIKSKTNRTAQLSSHGSYDSMSHHSSIQGESDSEPEIMNTISNQLRCILSSDSSDGDADDDDAMDAGDHPVFLTAKGPVSVVPESVTYDEIDSVETFKKSKRLCNYLIVNSQDQLLINVTPCAIDVVTEFYETLGKKDFKSVKSVRDLPPFEVFNQLGVSVKMSVSSDQKVYKDSVHNVTVESPYEKPKQILMDELDGIKLVDVDEDEIDGLLNLSKALSGLTSQMVGLSMVGFTRIGGEDDDDDVGRNSAGENDEENRRKLGKEQLHIKIEDFDELYNISFRRATTRMIPLTPTKNNMDYCVVYDVDIFHCRKVVTVRSPLQIYNHLAVPVQIFCDVDELQKNQIDVATRRGEQKFTEICTIESDKVYAVPIHVAYHCKLYVAPANMLYERTSDAIWWQEFTSNKESQKFYSCRPQTPNNNVFYFKVQWEEHKLTKQPMSILRSLPNSTLHLRASVVLHNLLPYNIHHSLEGSALSQLGPGENVPLFTANLVCNPKLQLQIINYLNLDWTGSFDLTSDLEEFKAINMESDINVEGQNKQLSLSIHMNQRLSMDLYVYSPYWIVNKTSLPVQIRGSRSEALYENNDGHDPLLFRFKKHRRKKAKLRVYNSKWTRSFSLDTVGNNGVVICYDKERNRKYQFLLRIELSRLKLTKIVTIMPYFLVVNNTQHILRYMEDNELADLWMDIAPNECCPFWPATDSPRMYIKYQNSGVSSQHFPVNRLHKTVLRMEKGTALVVETTITETSIVIKIMNYQTGDIPVRIDNLCEDVFLKLHQKKQGQVSLLLPNQSVLYTWDDPAAERTLMWNVYNRRKPSYPAFINKDGNGSVQLSIQTVRRSSTKSIYEERNDKNDSSPDDDSDVEAVDPKRTTRYLRQNTRTDKVVVYWVSFLDGAQRVLMLTQDERIAKKAIKMNEAEPATDALFASMSGLAISIVNRGNEEVAYVTVNSGATVWEVETKDRWKLLPMEVQSWLEAHWKKDDGENVLLEDLIEADLGKMEMMKPYRGRLRRTYNPALWLQLKQSQHNTYLHAKIHRIQVDNQLSDAYFPTVFHPYHLPSYVAKKSGPKPFVEFAVARRQVAESNLDTFKYVKLLVQELSINLDKGFIISVYDIFSSRQTPPKEAYLLGKDVYGASLSLADTVKMHGSNKIKRSLFEYLHFSPVKTHISISLDGRPHVSTGSMLDTNASVTSDIIAFFINSVGAKVIDVKNVELRMAYFEKDCVSLSFEQLRDQLLSHYKSQALQQAYVLLFGLDVLGNPYGLVKDFTQGLGDFFYEPFLGTFHEPDRYAENLTQGIRSLLRHTVGGAAASASAITKSLGKTLASLSFDSQYQKLRHRHIHQESNRLPVNLYKAGYSFAMGVSLGLSGVVLLPIKGSKEEGIEGFFKGVGKGLMGLITKPAGGIVDMVSMAFDGICRSAEMGEAIVLRMRLPRYVHPLGLKPFSTYQAIGMKILQTIDQCSDVYWAHASLSREEKSDVVLVTDKSVFLLKKCKGWGEWAVDWKVPLSTLYKVPLVQDGKLILRTKQTSYILTKDDRELSSADEELLVWLQKKIECAMKL